MLIDLEPTTFVNYCKPCKKYMGPKSKDYVREKMVQSMMMRIGVIYYLQWMFGARGMHYLKFLGITCVQEVFKIPLTKIPPPPPQINNPSLLMN